MESFQRLIAPLAAYPRWFVITCLVLVAIAAVWLLAKLVKWTLLLAFGALVVVAVLGGLFWLFG